MSWLFGKSSSSPTSDDTLKQTLGFDPKEVSDVHAMIQSPNLYSASQLHPLAGLDKGVEYLDLEDEKLNTVEGSQGVIPSRSWTDDLCYGTGAVYLLGLGIGGAYGFQEGIKNIPANSPPKLKLNTVLNHITKRGPFLGNSAGVLALTYNLIDSTIDAVRDRHDEYNSVAAGALAGALFKSSAGLKPMLYSSALMALGAGAWCGIKRAFISETEPQALV
ncbi:Mitochondrial import inner membrane translocase subunit TIM23 [Spathaspora sp. JA1]|nr:Mitochondrial import inner membrane translocase subunit TIM23 [Spathaspora sp. JA1]